MGGKCQLLLYVRCDVYVCEGEELWVWVVGWKNCMSPLRV